jgi:fucose 4-O-acetylase-like acetyltransferase
MTPRVRLEGHALQTTSHAEARPRARVEWIDIAKGIGILCVVLGHVSGAGMAGRVVYLFHMPLFFLLSGLLFRPVADSAGYARRKAVHLLVPYATGVALAGTVYLAHQLAHRARPLPLAPWTAALLWGGARFDGYFGVLWFLTCLYLAQQLLNLMMLRMSGAALPLAMVAMAGAGFLMSWYLPAMNWPLDANVVLVATPLLFCGVLLRRHPLPGGLALLLGALSFGLGIALLLRLPAAFMDMRAGHYGIPVVSFAIAVGCSLGIFELSRRLEGLPAVAAVLRQLGALSLGVMLLHKVVPVLHHVTGGRPLPVFLWDLAAAWAGAYVLSRLSWGRALFLGSERDWRALCDRFRRLLPDRSRSS